MPLEASFFYNMSFFGARFVLRKLQESYVFTEPKLKPYGGYAAQGLSHPWHNAR